MYFVDSTNDKLDIQAFLLDQFNHFWQFVVHEMTPIFQLHVLRFQLLGDDTTFSDRNDVIIGRMQLNDPLSILSNCFPLPRQRCLIS